MKLLIVLLALLTIIGGASAACVTPTNGMTVAVDTTLCGGTYSLAGGGAGAITITASGVAGNFLTLDCNGAIISGGGAGTNYGIYSSQSYLEIKNCTMLDYNTSSIYLAGSHNLVTDNNLSRRGTKIGAGLSLQYSVTDYNVLRNTISGRLYGLEFVFGSGVTGTTYINVFDNNLNDNNYGVYCTAYLYYSNFARNQAKNNYNWAILLSSYLSSNTISGDTNYNNSTNGIYYNMKTTATQGITISDLNLIDQNIPGYVIYIVGAHNVVRDVNIWNTNFMRNAYGLVFSNGTFYSCLDNNITRFSANNMKYGVYAIRSAAGVTQSYSITNSTFSDNNWGIFQDSSSAQISTDINVYGNTFLRSKNYDIRHYGTRGNIAFNTSTDSVSNIDSAGSSNKITDNNFVKTGAISGYGLYSTGSLDNNFLRNKIQGRSYAIASGGNSVLNYWNILDNNLSNNTYAIVNVANPGMIDNSTISRNNFNNNLWGIYNMGDRNTTISNNSFVDTNGIYLSAGYSATTYGVKIQDNNFASTTTTPSRTGIYFSRINADVNILRNAMNNLAYGIYYGAGGAYTYSNVLDNNITNCSSGIGRVSNGPYLLYSTVARNMFVGNVTFGANLRCYSCTISDNNFSKTGAFGGTGLYLGGGNTNVNIFRNVFTNRTIGLQFDTSTSGYNNIYSNVFSDNNYGYYANNGSDGNSTITNNTFLRNNAIALYMSGNLFRETISGNSFTDSANGINLGGITSRILISNNNINKSGARSIGSGIYTNNQMTDSNILMNTINNYLYGLTFNSNFNFSNIMITDNNFSDNNYGIGQKNAGFPSLVNPIILRNTFGNNYNYGFYFPGTGMALNYNCFSRNGIQARGGTFTDANYNYWSDWNGVTIPYSFTGGKDYSPSATCGVGDNCNPTINIDWNITGPILCTNKTLDINLGILNINSGGTLTFVNSTLITKGIQLFTNGDLIYLNTNSSIKIKN